MKISDIPETIIRNIREGTVIPAMPLALTGERQFSERYQRTLVRYYIDAGAGGLAVGVHSTQFEIRDPDVGLFEPVLKLASQEIDSYSEKRGVHVAKIAGVCGKTPQAIKEAEFAAGCGYHACLLNVKALKGADGEKLIEHCRYVADIMPVIGFYLQTPLGGLRLSRYFWENFARIDNTLAVKIASFDRYQTLETIQGICNAGKANEISLYTGNDDNIVVDLLTTYELTDKDGEKRKMRFVGGLLGHWAVWTKKAVELLAEIKKIREADEIPAWMLTRAAEVTDTNSAIFDPQNDFAGCVPGIHEILHRQGLLESTVCIDPDHQLSDGQIAEIDRVCRQYPHLTDDSFVSQHLENWID